MQEIVAAKAFYGAVRAIVLTNNTFSASAVALGKANGVGLMGRRSLAELLAKATKRPAVSEDGGTLVVSGLTDTKETG